MFIISYRAYLLLVGEWSEEFFLGFDEWIAPTAGEGAWSWDGVCFGIWKLRPSLPWSWIRVKSGSAPPLLVRLGTLINVIVFSVIWVFYVTVVIFSMTLLMNKFPDTVMDG